MKKILSLVLTVMMFFTMASFDVAAAEILTPVSIYAGARTITVEYDSEIASENTGEISITTLEGAAVPYTTKINDEFLTIIADEEFVRDTQSYLLQVGNAKKVFKVKTLFKPEFEKISETAVKDLCISTNEWTGSVIDVVDKDTLILGSTYDNFVLDYDDVANYENASLVADVYYIAGNAKRAHSILAYNISSKEGLVEAFTGANKLPKVSRAAWFRQGDWIITEGDRYFDRMVAIVGGNSFVFKGFAKADAIAPIAPLEDRDNNAVKPAIFANTYGTAFTVKELTIGATQLPDNFDREYNKYHYVIDKMGAVGTLMMNDTFIDIMDTQDYYDEYNTANGTSLKAATKGFFAINPISASNNYRIIVSNMALITSEMEDYKEGDITVPSTELTGTRNSINLVFSDAVELASAKVKSHILVSKEKDGARIDVDYDYVINGDTITITPADGLDYDTVYYVTVKEGFGYNAYTVKSDVEATYMYESLKGDLYVTDVYAGYRDVYLTFNGDVEQIKTADFKDKVKVEFNGEELSYSIKLNGNRATITLDKELEVGKIYDLSVLEGLGYEKVTVKEAKKNYFTLEKVYSTDFANFPQDSSSSTLFSSKHYDPNDKYIPYKTVRNGKLFAQTTSNSTLHFNKMGIEKLERYSLKIKDVQYFGNNVQMMLYFNMSGDGGIFAGQGGKPLTGFGWHTTSTEKQARDFLAKGVKATTSKDKVIHADPENPVTISVASSEDVKFASNADDVDVTVPESNGNSYTYTLDKIGTLGRLYINDTFVDSYETADVFEKWNKISSADQQITADIPTKGYIMLGFHEKITENTYTVALGDFEVVCYKEYTDGGVKISKDDATINGNSASGTIKVRNYFANDTKKVAVVVSAYGENNKFLGVKKVVDTQLDPSEIATASYSFSATEEIKEVKAEIIDETSVSYTDEISVTSALQTDLENNIITIKGNVKAEDKDRKIYMLLSKDNQMENWSLTNENDGNFAIVDIPAKATTFEYSFNYKEFADVEPYEMSVYALTWADGVKPKKLATYNCATNEDVLAFVENVKTTKTTFAEALKYAQSLGVDISFADKEYKQNVLVETIYSERETISDANSLALIMGKAKARADLLSVIKKDATSVSVVDTILTTYANKAGLDLTEYNKLSVNQKNAACAGFIKADYEELGFMKFAEAFKTAVNNAKPVTTPAAGGGGGGGSGGVIAPPVTQVIPGKEVTVDAEEKEETITEKSAFADMTDYTWAEKAVDYLAKKEIISGTGNNMFNPEGIITREQIAKIMVLATGRFDNDATADYTDVDSEGWAYKYIASAKKSGLMNGFTATEFAPLSPITREDLAVIIYRAMTKQGKLYEVKKNNFTDFSNISDYATEAVEYIAGAGIINGFDDGSFKPQAPATRAQAAVLIYNALTGGVSK